MAECFNIMALRRFAEAWHAVEGGMPQEELAKTFGESSDALKQVLRVHIARAKGEL